MPAKLNSHRYERGQGATLDPSQLGEGCLLYFGVELEPQQLARFRQEVGRDALEVLQEHLETKARAMVMAHRTRRAKL